MCVMMVEFSPPDAHLSIHRICFKDTIEGGEEEQHTFLETALKLWLWCIYQDLHEPHVSCCS